MNVSRCKFVLRLETKLQSTQVDRTLSIALKGCFFNLSALEMKLGNPFGHPNKFLYKTSLQLLTKSIIHMGLS